MFVRLDTSISLVSGPSTVSSPLTVPRSREPSYVLKFPPHTTQSESSSLFNVFVAYLKTHSETQITFFLRYQTTLSLTNEYGSLPEWYRQGNTELLGENLSQRHSVHHRSPCGLTWDRKSSSAVRWRLTVCAISWTHFTSGPHQPVVRGQHATHDSVMLLVETSETRKVNPKWNAKAILKIYELFIYRDIHYQFIL